MTNEEFIGAVRLEGEDWRDVVGWEGSYMVSSMGRVLSLQRIITLKNGKPYAVRQRILKPNVTLHNGIRYAYICLRRNSERHTVAIHRLEATAFLPNPDSLPDVDHIDRNGLNNHIGNLRWCNRKMNMSNENTRKVMSASQHNKKMPSSYKPVVQLKDKKVIGVYVSITEASRQTKISTGSICTGCKHNCRRYGGFNWMYLSD